MPDTEIHDLRAEHAELRATLAFLREQIAEAEDAPWARGPGGGGPYLASLLEQENECRGRLAEIAQALELRRAATLDGMMAKAAVLGGGSGERMRRATLRAMPEFAGG